MFPRQVFPPQVFPPQVFPGLATTTIIVSPLGILYGSSVVRPVYTT